VYTIYQIHVCGFPYYNAPQSPTQWHITYSNTLVLLNINRQNAENTLAHG